VVLCIYRGDTMNYLLREVDIPPKELHNYPVNSWMKEGMLVNKTIRVLIADDHPLIRTALRGTLAPAPDLTVIGEASNGKETLQRAQQWRPDVLLLDLSMPGPSALDIVVNLRGSLPTTHILVLTAFDDDAYIRPLMNAGIHGYLLKDEAPDVIVQAIRAVAQGLHWFSPIVLADLTRQVSDVPPVHLIGLHPDDQPLLWAVVAGWNSQQIASVFDLPENDVRTTIKNLCQKLGVKTRNDLVLWAQRLGIQPHSV
jgi:DNA-binding NarL/FixJ family response regulator